MTEGQRVKLEELIEDYETAIVTLAIEPHSKWASNRKLKVKAHDRITDHLDLIQNEMIINLASRVTGSAR